MYELTATTMKIVIYFNESHNFIEHMFEAVSSSRLAEVLV